MVIYFHKFSEYIPHKCITCWISVSIPISTFIQNCNIISSGAKLKKNYKLVCYSLIISVCTKYNVCGKKKN